MTEPLRFLVLGGTAWLGGEVARAALDRGHRVTCLARGWSGQAPPGTVFLRADRAAADAYDQVASQDWDVVLDVSWQPDQVRSALAALAPRAHHWVYVSSISAYADHSLPGADESAPLLPVWDGSGEAPGEAYGEAKVSCETACRDAVGDRVLVARAGLIVGYGDRSDRFGYWPARFARAARGDRVLAPPLDAPVQVVDVRDLAWWLVDSASRGLTGAFDATGSPMSFSHVATACVAVTGQSPELVSPGESWLLDAGVMPWAGPGSLPLWAPGEAYRGHAARAATAARDAGLPSRPVAETVSDALRWERELGLDRDRGAGLTTEREADLLRGLLRQR